MVVKLVDDTNLGVIFQPELYSMNCISLVKFNHISVVLSSNSFLVIPLWARRIFTVWWELSSWP